MEDNANMPRRKFLALASAAGLGGAALLASDAFAVAGGNDLGKVTQPMFAPHVGTAFQFHTADGQSVEVSLVRK